MLTKMPENPGIPPLFRDIFKNAFLPYRDPETLRAFLKIIDEFEYDHSERLGDAFEYLLSVLGSQGDAGQFRTPRHIIDFIVEVVDPKKDETVLDPACGTAGFLISAWKHILRTNSSPEAIEEKPDEEAGKEKLDSSRIPPARGDLLTPDERARLTGNIKGYDISPDMVRLSLVNLYLHGFADPHIAEYDTLTSDERWNEHADVILANPPFMSPKGGIRPHNRFSVQSKRSEVLFVDYIAEHLTPNGRAGIIVPEGIIFQSQNAYKQLRQMLVDDYLVAVVSLPAGVFQPYSGVKTSILILDKVLARQADTIAFFKIEHDGFALGAQRRPIDKNDLPQARAEIAEYLRRLRARESVEDFQPALGLVVVKDKIAANGDYNLSGQRYREGIVTAGLIWPLVPLGELCVIERGASPRPIRDYLTEADHGVNWVKIGDAEVGAKYITKTKERVTQEGAAKSRRVKPGDFILSNSMSFGRPYVMATEGCIHDGWLLLREQSERLDQDFLYNILGSEFVVTQFKRSATGGVVNNLNSEIVRGVTIPLPPLDVQKEIVAEIERYQKVIDGARAVLDNYRPRIPIQPDWPMVEIGEVCTLLNGRAFKPSDWEKADSGGLPIVRIQNLNKSDAEFNYFTGEVAPRNVIEPGELLFSWSGSRGTSFGAHVWSGPSAVLNQHIFKVEFPPDRANKTFLLHALNGAVAEVEDNLHGGVGLVHITKGNLERIKIPFPTLREQDAVAAEMEAEQALVAGNRQLIARFENKIQATLARVWGEKAPEPADA